MKRKITASIICIAILISFLVSASPAKAASNDNSVIRVKLSMGSPTAVSVYVDGNYSVEESSSIYLKRQLYTVKLISGELRLYYGNTLLYRGDSITLVQHAPSQGLNNFLRLNNSKYGYRNYLGDMKFIISGSSISVINYVYLEYYLYGVVPYEMSDSWPLEALKSQAVAARTYAVRQMGSGIYDILDTSQNQVYKGYDPGNSRAIVAVNGTAKKVLTYNGELAYTYYSASNGGYTDIPCHVWGGGRDLAYFELKEDIYDDQNPSSLYEGVFFPVSISESTPIYSADNVSGTPNIENAVKIIKQRIFYSDKLSGYGVTSVNDFELTGVLNLYAHTLDMDGENHTIVPDYPVGACIDFVKATGNFTVDINGETVTVEDLELDLRYFDGSNDVDTYKVFNSSSLRLFVVKEAQAGNIVTGYWIYQKRYGHGLGLSQRGAQSRANDGHKYTDILDFYYTGTSLDALSISPPALTSMPDMTGDLNATVVNTSNLNVRESDSASSNILGSLPKGARVQIDKAYYTTDWHRITFGGQYAYVHKDYIKLDSRYLSIDSGANYLNNSGNTHKIAFTIGDPGQVTVRIQYTNGKTVTNIINNQSYYAPGTYETYWDGKDSTGKAMPSGMYYITLIEWDSAGDGWYIRQPLTYTDDLRPTITAASTYTKNSDNKYQIIFRTKFDCKVTVRVSNSAGNTVRNILYRANSTKGGHTAYWDGKDSTGKVLPSGQYYITVIEYDTQGNYWYTKQAFTYTLVKTPTLWSNSRYPKTSNNKHLIKFSIGQDTKVSIVIRDAAGKSIRYIVNKSDFNAGQYNVYWDGKDSKGNVVPSGLYYIYGIQYDEDGKYTYTKKKLAVEISEKPTITSNSYYTRTGTNRHLIKVDIATPALVSTVIKDGNLKSVIYLEYKASHQDGKIYLYWDGKDKSGNDMPDGIYYIYAIQYKDDGSYTYTRKKLVLN